MSWEDAYYSLMTPAQEESQDPDYYAGSRGFIGGTASGVLRGLAGAASTTGAGLEEMGIENPIRETIASAEKKFDILKPDIPEAFGLDSGVYGDIKRLPQQITESVATPIIGGVAGTVATGSPVGAAVGAAGAMVTQFGLGTKREKTEEYLIKHPGDFEGAEAYGTIHGVAELGFEAASNAFAAVTFGGSKFITAAAKSGVKSTAREMLSFSAGQLGKDTLKSGGVEMASEMATYGVQSAADVSYGMGDGITGEGLQSTAVTTAGMSLIFAAVGAKYQSSQRKQLISMLEGGSESDQTKASSLITKELTKSGDGDLANAWDSYASSRIQRGLPVDLDADYISLGDKITQEKTMPGDILSSNPDVQKNAVDEVLKQYGIGEDGGPVQGPETFEEHLDQFLPETEDQIADRQWKEEEAKAAADVYYRGEPKRTLGSVATGATQEELSDFVKAREEDSRWKGIQGTPRQPSTTLGEIVAQDEALARSSEEREAKKFEEESLAYRQGKNLKQLAEIEPVSVARNKEINALIDAAMPLGDTNDVVRQAAKDEGISEEEARATLHTNLSNYRKTVSDYMTEVDLKKMASLRGSTNAVIRTMMQEVKADSNDLTPVIKKAGDVASSSIKGSKQQREAEAVVEVTKKVKAAKVKADKIVAKQEKAVEAIVSTPTPKPIPTPVQGTKTQQEAVQAPYTLDDTMRVENETVASVDNTKGVEVAQMETPEDRLIREEATEATMDERLAREDAEEKAESGIPELNEIVNKSGDPILTSLVNKNETGLRNALKDKVTNNERQAAILSSLKKVGEAPLRKHVSTIQPLVEWAISAVNSSATKSIKGAKWNDAISWPTSESGSRETSVTGTHKESGQKILIEQKGEKRSSSWEIKVDGKVVGEAAGKTEARRKAEEFVSPLSNSKLEELKKASSTRSGKALTPEEKQLNENYNEATRKIAKKESVADKQEVAPVTVIDAKTGKKKTVEYRAPSKRAQEGLSKADTKAEAKSREEELAALTREQEEDEDVKLRKKSSTKEDYTDEYSKIPNIPSNLQRLLDSHSWDAEKVLKLIKDKYGDTRPEAENILNTLIGNKKSRQDKENQKLSSIFTNGMSTLEYVVKSGSPVEKAIAKLIIANTSKTKINSIIFRVDAYAKSASYKNGVVTLTETDPRPALHEFIHAVTVQEMKANPELRRKVISLMDKVKAHALKEDILTNYQIKFLEKNSTSKMYKANKDGVIFGDVNHIAYALINENEFLAQALSDVKFQEFLKGIELENPKGSIRTLWDAIVRIVGEALGLSNMHHNMLSEVLTISVELMRQEEIEKSTLSHEDSGFDFIDKELRKLHREDKTEEVSWREKALSKYERFEEGVSNTFQSTYDNLATISKKLAEKLRSLDFDVQTKVTERASQARPFEEAYKNLSKKDKVTLNFLLQNYNANGDFRTKLSTFLEKNKMVGEFTKVVEMLKGIHEEFEIFGLNNFDEVEFYFPRRIKDYDGLVRYLRKQEDWGVMDEALKEAEDRYKADNKGKTMTDNDRAHVLAKMISTGRRPTAYLKTPTSSKQRTITIVNAKMMDFYYDPIESLGMHIGEATERIEVNRMLGVTNRKKIIDQARTKWKEMKRLKKEKASSESFNKVSKEYQELRAKLPEMDAEIENSIGDITAKLVGSREITEDQQRRANGLIRARITEKGPNRLVGAIRQAALLGTLTQLTTGVRQLSDNVWTIYRSGGLNTLKAAINVVSNKNIIKENFLDFQQPLKEFTRSTRLLDNMLKLSGLSLMDNLGKKISMEASLLKYKKTPLEDFQKQWEGVLTPERIEQVHKDAKAGNVTRDLKYLVVSDIANFQPVFKSEQSKEYLQGGNARIFYLLKSYALKSAGAIYRESINEIRSGNTTKGLKNLAHLGGLFILLGASTDWLVDWLNGKSPVFTDSMIDTALTLGLLSQYTLDKGSRDGSAAWFSQALPPTKLIDLPGKDLINLVTGEPSYETMKLIPGVGSLMYNRLTSGGQKSAIDKMKKDVYKQAVGGSTPSSEISELNAKIRSYNVGKRKEDKIALITPGVISEKRKKEREKNVR